MPFQVWTGGKFDTSHERRALMRLLREMVTRFGEAEDPYALLVDFQVGPSRLDLVALTSRAIVLMDLKEGGSADAAVAGSLNGEWRIEQPGSGFALNKGRAKNPHQQLSDYRWSLIQWFDTHKEAVFGAQKAAQLKFSQVDAWLCISPTIDEAQTRANLSGLEAAGERWFRVIGLDRACDELAAEIKRDLFLTGEEIAGIAVAHGLTQRRSWEGLLWPGELAIPNPPVFGPPPVSRTSVDREDAVAAAERAVRGAEQAVVVIGGTGGVGKTHLAGLLAGRLADEHRVYWVDCGQARGCEPSLESLLLAFANQMKVASIESHRAQAQVVADKDQPEVVRIDAALHFCEAVRACLFLDDYHELRPDHGVERFIRRLDRCCRGACVVVTTRKRPDFLLDPLDPIRACLELDLTGLGPEWIIPYLERHPSHGHFSLAATDSGIIWERTGGLPIVLDWLARLAYGRSAGDVAREQVLALDQRTQSWLQRLLNLVSEDARRLAQALSVLDRAFDRELALSMTDSSNRQALLSELIAAYILEPRGDRHLVLGGVLRDYLCERMHEETRRKAHERAMRHLLRVAEGAPADPQLLEQVVAHAHAAGKPAIVLQHAGPVVADLAWRGEWARELRTCERALEAAVATKDERGRARWTIEKAASLRHQGKNEPAEQACREGLRMAEKLRDPALQARACSVLGNLALARRDYPEARRLHELALQGDASDPVQAARSFFDLSVAEKYAGELDLAREHLERSLAMAREHGLSLQSAMALSQLAEVSYRMGRFDEAWAFGDAWLAEHEADAGPRGRMITLGILADIHLARGDAPAARAALERARAAAGAAEDPIGASFARKRAGLLAILEGDAPCGTALVREAASEFRLQGRDHYADDCEQALARALARRAAQPPLPLG